jgi:hypothetical protein
MQQRSFSPRLDILPPPQRALWSELADTPAVFTLYGGTAIALNLGHRQSVDFDFFSHAPFDPDALLETPYLAGASVVQRAPGTLVLRIDRDGPVLVSYFATPALGEIEPPSIAPDNGLKIASLIDLAALKTVVVQKRAEAKDYIDLDALMRNGVLLADALAAARIIQGPAFNPQVSLKALSYFEEGNLASLDAATRSRIQAAVARIDPAKLPRLSYNRAYAGQIA